jgi:spore coat polysaccharide biosynthesis protein SpsF (cytidylyltransferase family)
MSDFEVHPIGTANEIKLSRELANAIANQIDKEDNPHSSWDATKLPNDIREIYYRLYNQYQIDIQSGNI